LVVAAGRDLQDWASGLKKSKAIRRIMFGRWYRRCNTFRFLFNRVFLWASARSIFVAAQDLKTKESANYLLPTTHPLFANAQKPFFR
jgi:hypothetical protein